MPVDRTQIRDWTRVIHSWRSGGKKSGITGSKWEESQSLILEMTKCVPLLKYRCREKEKRKKKKSTHLSAILLLSNRPPEKTERWKNNLKMYHWRNPLRCAPWIRMENIALTLENVEYLYRKYPKNNRNSFTFTFFSLFLWNHLFLPHKASKL